MMRPVSDFRDSDVVWAPRLPREWRETRLQRVCKIFAGGTPDRSNLEYWTNGEIPWLNSGSVNDGVITRPSALITAEAARGGRTRWAPAGSVVIALAGQGKTKGMAARLEFASTLNQSMAAIVPSGRVAYRYLHYWLSANYQLVRNLAGGELRDGLNLQHVGSIQMPLPDEIEQRAIADFLDRETGEIDAFIRDQEELIGLLHERQRAAVAHEFEPILDVSGQSFRPTPLSVALRERDQRALSEQLPMYSVSIHKGVVPWAEINDGEPSADSFAHYKRIVKDDLVLNRMRAFQGSSGLAPGRGMVSPDYAVFSVKAAAYPPFLQLLMKSQPMVEAMKQRLRGIGAQDSGAIRTPRINARDLLRIRVDLPNRVEQEAITERVQRAARETESLLSDARSAVELSRERRSALISAAVTGKIDVREHVGV